MSNDIESEIFLSQRRKHASRISFASACIALRCGVKIKFTREARPGYERSGVYAIDGIDGEFVGLPAVRAKLYDLGERTTVSAVTKRLAGGVLVVGAYTVRRVGLASRKPTKMKAGDE